MTMDRRTAGKTTSSSRGRVTWGKGGEKEASHGREKIHWKRSPFGGSPRLRGRASGKDQETRARAFPTVERKHLGSNNVRCGGVNWGSVTAEHLGANR